MAVRTSFQTRLKISGAAAIEVHWSQSAVQVAIRDDRCLLKHYPIWLVVEPPLKNMSSSVGMMTFPMYGKIKNDPNHQLAI